LSWQVLALIALSAVVVGIVLIYWATRELRAKEPYASVLRLRTRDKIRFFKLIVTDNSVPKTVKIIPIMVALYLAMPIDLIPDFIPVLGYLDDVAIVIGALALIVRLLRSELLYDLIDTANTKPASTGDRL
jgi:uncharacterized membrane protein YkvA (DUF1232 family)